MKPLTFTLLLIPILFLSNGYTQDWTTWRLPEGAKRRIGKGDISHLKFSSNGDQLAVSTTIGIWMYDAHTGTELALFTGHTEEVKDVAFSPDGRILASTANDMTIGLWDTETGEQLALLPMGEESFFLPLAFSPDGTLLAAGSGHRSGIIQTWDVATGNPIATLRGHTDRVETLVFSPDGKILASGGEDRSIRLWDIEAGTHLSTLTGHKMPVAALKFSPDGTVLASSNQRGIMRLWDPKTGKQLRPLVRFGLTLTDKKLPTLTHPTSWIEALAFSPDGSILVSGNHDGAIQMWRVENGRLLSTIEAHTEAIRALTFSRNGTVLMSGDWAGTFHAWDASTGEQLSGFTLSGHEHWGIAFGFSADGATLMSTGWGLKGNAMRFWDIDTGEAFAPIMLQPFVALEAAFSPNGKTLASTGSGSDAHMIWLWDLPEGREHAVVVGHTGAVRALAFSSDNRTLASGGADTKICLWDVDTRKLIQTLEGHEAGIKALVFSPDNRMLASGSYQSIRLWDVTTGRSRAPLLEREDLGQPKTVALAFSSDGKILATAGNSRLRLWNVDARRMLSEFAIPKDRIEKLVFSPDSVVLVGGSTSGVIYLWDVNTLALLFSIKTHPYGVLALKFSPDGKTLASGGMDSSILLWDWGSLASQ